MMATAQQKKIHRHRRDLALWSSFFAREVRERAAHLHDGRPKLDFGSGGFVELKVTQRGAGCAECGRKIPAGTLALYADSGDVRRTPYPRYLHLERCTGSCSDCGFYPCRCRLLLSPPSPRPERVYTTEELAARGLRDPGLLTPSQVRAVCELALASREDEEGAA